MASVPCTHYDGKMTRTLLVCCRPAGFIRQLPQEMSRNSINCSNLFTAELFLVIIIIIISSSSRRDADHWRCGQDDYQSHNESYDMNRFSKVNRMRLMNAAKAT